MCVDKVGIAGNKDIALSAMAAIRCRQAACCCQKGPSEPSTFTSKSYGWQSLLADRAFSSRPCEFRSAKHSGSSIHSLCLRRSGTEWAGFVIAKIKVAPARTDMVAMHRHQARVHERRRGQAASVTPCHPLPPGNARLHNKRRPLIFSDTWLRHSDASLMSIAPKKPST